jgi:VWFA-related protein
MTLFRMALVVALFLHMAPIPQQPPVPTIKIDTKLTVVNVTVTDKYGQPVRGLKQSDFVIKEDGEPQPIRNFDDYSPSHPPAASAAPQLPPGIYSNQPGPAATGDMNIILFSQLEPADDLKYARSEAEKYIKTMPEGTRITIMVLQDGLRVLQNITTDRNLLLGAIDTLQHHEVGGAFDSVRGKAMACFAANQRNRLALNALDQIAASVSAIKGKKNLIWFTRGIPLLTNYIWYRISCLDDDTKQLHQSYSMLAAAQVAIYPIDPHGLEGHPLDGGISAGSLGADFADRQLDQESMRDFAEATGGKAFFNRNDLDGEMRQAIDAGSDYYSIGYTPPLKGYDGKYHSISVTVDQPGLQLSYRKGYTSLDLTNLEKAIADAASSRKPEPDSASPLPPAVSAFRADMGHGTPPATQLLFLTRVVPTVTPAQAAPVPVQGNLNPKVKPQPLIRYDVVYSIPVGELTFSGGHAAAEFDIVAYGEDGTRLNYLSQTAQLTVKSETTAGQDGLLMPFQLDLPPGKLFLRIGVIDLSSGKYGTIEVPQAVDKPAKEKP